MQFNVIVCDSPWAFNDKLKMSDVKRSAESNYSTLSNLDLINLNVNSLSSNDGTIIALWVPSSILDIGFECLQSYGFKLKQTYCWVKIKNNVFKNLIKKILKLSINTDLINNLKNLINDFNTNINNNLLSFGMGRLTRATHEIALIGINNNLIYKKLKNKSQRSVCLVKNEKHSKKPENLQDSLDIMFDGPKIELFARRQRPGWICIGNEAPLSFGECITVSIKKAAMLSTVDYELILNELNNKNFDNARVLWSNIKI